MLEDAWDALPDSASLRQALRDAEKAQRVAIANGSIISTSANGQSVTFAGFGQGQATPLQIAEAYRYLIDQVDRAFTFLSQCAMYSLDAFTTEQSGFYGNPSLAQNPIVLDTTGRWANECLRFTVSVDDVIGQPVRDAAVFLWVMYHLNPITEVRSDYTMLRTGGTGPSFV